MSCWNPAKGRAIRRSSLWFVGHGNERPGAARRLVTFLARPRKVTKGRPPRCRAPCSQGHPALLTRCGDCATRPGRAHTTCPAMGLTRFPAGASLGRNPSREHLYRQRQSESTHPFPQTELRLTSHRCTVLVEKPHIESSCSARHKGSNGNGNSNARNTLATTLLPPRHDRY